MTQEGPQIRREWLHLALILGATALVCIPGIQSRDLTGDELGALGSGFRHLMDRSIEVHRPDQFSAHLPLAWVIRDVFHAIFGTDGVWVWRLHALLGVMAGAGVTWWVVRQHASAPLATACGLFVGLSPILTFHSRDSTNYALDPMTGALLLGGMAAVAAGRRRAGLLLALGLVLGSVNDYYFFLTVIVAALVSPLLLLGSPDWRASLRSLAVGWGLYLALAAWPAVVFFRRLQGVDRDQLFAKHADLDDGLIELSDTVPRKLDEFAVSYLEGYEGVWTQDPWASTVASTLLSVTLLWGLLSRDRLLRISALLLGGTALVLTTISVVFQNEVGRAFPLFPRNYLNVLPALAVLWTFCLAKPLGRRWGIPAVLALLLLLGGASLRQALNTSDTRIRLLDRMDQLVRPGDSLLAEVNLHLRVDTRDFAQFSAGSCIPDDWKEPERLWYWRLNLGEDTPALQRCSGASLEGYRVRLVEDAYSPPHDHQTNSHLTPIRLYLFEKGPALDPAPKPSWTVRLDPRLASGASGAVVAMTWEMRTGEDRHLDDQDFARTYDVGPAPEGARRLRVQVRSRPLPAWLRSTRLAPRGDELMSLNQLELPDDALSAEIRHPVWALSSPWIHVLRQSLAWVLWFSLLAAMAAALVELASGLVVWARSRRG